MNPAEIASAVMARQEIDGDTFAVDVRRVANRLAYGQEAGTEDVLLVRAAELYLRYQAPRS